MFSRLYINIFRKILGESKKYYEKLGKSLKIGGSWKNRRKIMEYWEKTIKENLSKKLKKFS